MLGDFNATPRSRVYRRLAAHLCDAQAAGTFAEAQGHLSRRACRCCASTTSSSAASIRGAAGGDRPDAARPHRLGSSAAPGRVPDRSRQGAPSPAGPCTGIRRHHVRPPDGSQARLRVAFMSAAIDAATQVRRGNAELEVPDRCGCHRPCGLSPVPHAQPLQPGSAGGRRLGGSRSDGSWARPALRRRAICA